MVGLELIVGALNIEPCPPPNLGISRGFLCRSPQFSALVGKTSVSCPLLQELRKDKMAEAYSEIGMKSDVSVTLSLFPRLVWGMFQESHPFLLAPAAKAHGMAARGKG